MLVFKQELKLQAESHKPHHYAGIKALREKKKFHSQPPAGTVQKAATHRSEGRWNMKAKLGFPG